MNFYYVVNMETKTKKKKTSKKKALEFSPTPTEIEAELVLDEKTVIREFENLFPSPEELHRYPG